MWVSEEGIRRQRYDCEDCIKRDLRETERHCFIFEKKCRIYAPTFQEPTVIGRDVELKIVHGKPAYDVHELTANEFIDLLGNIQKEWFPDEHPFKVLFTWFGRSSIYDPDTQELVHTKEICPRGVANIDMDVVLLCTLEEWASQYHILPYTGAIMDQPNVIFEAFNVIMSTRAQYVSKQHEKMKADMERMSQTTKAKQR